MSDDKATASSYPIPRATIDFIIKKLSLDQPVLEWKQRYDPVSELIWTILSQHTSDLNADKSFRVLLDTFGSWEAVAQAEAVDITRAIWVGGLSKVKGPRIKSVLTRIKQLKGELILDFLKEMPLPEAKSWLRQLPGVGPKTAAVVLCFSLGMPAMPVDTHVYRVALRLGLIGTKTTPEEAHDLLESQVDPQDVLRFHVYVISHGRRICKAIRPLCERCILESRCPASILRHAR
jgi:endonuclease-3